MKRAMPAVVLTLILSSGCSDSPVAPSTVSDGARPRLAPFRNSLDSVPDRTRDDGCGDAAVAPIPPLGPRLTGVSPVPLPDACHQRRNPHRFDR